MCCTAHILRHIFIQEDAQRIVGKAVKPDTQLAFLSDGFVITKLEQSMGRPVYDLERTNFLYPVRFKICPTAPCYLIGPDKREFGDVLTTKK